jgi:hypothetical protein
MTETTHKAPKHRESATDTKQRFESVRHPFRTARRRRVLAVTAGAAAVVALSAGIATGEQAGRSQASEDPSATAGTTASDTAIVRAQAEATILTARGVATHAGKAASAQRLQQDITRLSNYPKMGSASIRQQIVQTVDTSNTVSAQNAAAIKAQADRLAAARVAAAKAAAAEAAAQRAAAQKAAAAAAAAKNTPSAAKATASAMASSKYGWGADQFACLSSLWTKESGWNYRAYNSSGAFGIPQALPGSKMATVGSDWQTNASTQIAWGLEYISAAYGTPCAAWAHSEASNFY